MARPSVEAERKEQILRSACNVIAERGISGLRVADVARDAGVSPGIIHYYFDNKRDLMRAAFEENFQYSLERRAAIFDSDQDSPSKLRALVDAYLPEGDETVAAWHVWVELWAEGLRDEGLRDLNDRAYGEWRRIIAGVIRDGQAAGQIGAGDPVEIANMLVGMLDGLALQVLVGSHAMTVARMRKVCQVFVDRILGLTID